MFFFIKSYSLVLRKNFKKQNFFKKNFNNNNKSSKLYYTTNETVNEQKNFYIRKRERTNNELLLYALKNTSPVTLREMIEFGKNNTPRTILLAAQFLHQELAIRIAHRVRDLKRLPYGLSETPSIQNLIKLYEQSFWKLREFPTPKSSNDEIEFTNLITEIKKNHNNVQLMMANGMQELWNRLKNQKNISSFDSSFFSSPSSSYFSHSWKTSSLEEMQVFDFSRFLDRFYMSRISIRMLISQHEAIHEKIDGYVGIIQQECRPRQIALHAIEDAQLICKNTYAVSPEVQILGKDDPCVAYIPSHLYYIIFELLKNSMRAVVENHDHDNLPPVQLVIADGNEDFSIKISDRGGGIPRSGMNRIWTYAYTTMTSSSNPTTNTAPMAGFGHGLPLSRLYARYLGGDLQVISMQGFGTDAYVHINKLGNIDEQLP